MGRWIGIAAVALPLALFVLALSFGFEGFLRSDGREGLATPSASSPRPVTAKAPPREKAITRVEARILEPGTFDEATVTPTDSGIKLQDVKVEPIYKDVKVQEEQGISVVFAIDNSLSMIDGMWGRGNDPTYQRVEATRAALAELKPIDRAAIVTFPRVRALGERYSYNVPIPGLFHRFAAPSVVAASLNDLREREDGGTPLFSGAELAFQTISREPSDRAKVVVVLTDGRQEPPMIVPSSLLEAKDESGAKVYGITLGANTDLAQMSSFTDEIRQVSAASDLVGVFRGLIEKNLRQKSGYLVTGTVEREGQPFASGEKIRLRAWIGGRPRILEAVAE